MIILRTAAIELQELNDDIAFTLWIVTRDLSCALKTHCDANKISTSTIGNVVPQLHAHIAIRHNDYAAWPLPI